MTAQIHSHGHDILSLTFQLRLYTCDVFELPCSCSNVISLDNMVKYETHYSLISVKAIMTVVWKLIRTSASHLIQEMLYCLGGNMGW